MSTDLDDGECISAGVRWKPVTQPDKILTLEQVVEKLKEGWVPQPAGMYKKGLLSGEDTMLHVIAVLLTEAKMQAERADVAEAVLRGGTR